NTTPATKIALIDDFDFVLGLDIVKAAKALIAEEEAKAAAEDADPFVKYIKERIADRIAAKKAKDFATADAIRAELLEKGVTIIDTREGTDFKIEK
ncbi:MAG: cysteine--tRNA ligase, partial [Clostridia bacterium]|nr:cysteine--tRNA ligase [Clostridia bacterium]